MKYIYIVGLIVLLFGMFFFGEQIPQSPSVTYSTAPVKPLSTTYTKRDYCAPEIDTEVTKYQLELSNAQNKITALQAELDAAKAATISGTPTPTPTITVTPTLTPTPTQSPTPTEKQVSSPDDKKASSSANK